MKSLFFGLCLLLPSIFAYSHGNHGGVGGKTAQLSIVELPLHISLSGDVELHLPLGLSEEAHEESIVTLSPVVGVAFNSTNSLINLELAESGLISELEKAQEETPYMFIRERESGVGLGTEAHIGHHDGAQIFPGLFPSKSKKLTGMHRIVNRSEKWAAPLLKVPWTLSDEATWSVGDSLNYISSGSINFSVGAGFEALAALGTEVTVTGTWSTSIQKVAEKKLEVTISHEKLKNLGVFASGVWVINGSQNWMKSFTRAFTYQFDLSHSAGLKAYQDFIHGKFKFAQTYAKKSQGVSEVTHSQKNAVGKNRNLTLGISMILGWNHSVGTMYEISDSFHDDHQDRVYSHVFSKEQSATGVMIKDYSRSEMIVSMVYDHEEEKSEGLHYELQYKWMYEKNKMNLNTFSKKLSDQFRSVGLYDVKYDFSDVQMGFMRGEFDIHFTDEHFTELEKVASLWEKWEKKRLALTRKNCEGEETPCYIKNARRVRTNLSYLKNYFMIIQDAHKRSDARMLSLHLNLFFQAMLKSRENFPIMSDFTDGLEAKIQIKGEKIKQYFWSQPIMAYAP